MRKKYRLKTWREALKLGIRALGLFYRRDPQLVLSRIISAIWASLTPYVGIYLAALIVGELAGSRDMRRLKLLACAALVSAALIALVAALLNKWKETRNAGFWFKVEHIYSKKLLTMDYSDIDSTETADLLSTIRQNQNSGGWGLYRALSGCEALCHAVLTLAGGVSMTVSLFVSRVPDNAGAYRVLNEPLLIAAVIAILLLITLAAPALANKAGSYWARHADAHKFLNRAFGFFATLGQRRDIAADVRIYRQDAFCEKYNRSKEVSVGSKGLFAHLSRGPIGLCSAASAAVSVAFTGAVYVFVCLKAWSGAFGPGAVIQYVASVTKVSGGLSSLISTLGDMRNNASFLAQVFEFLDMPNRMRAGTLPVDKRRGISHQIEFRNVSFKYPGCDAFALRNVSLKLDVGRRLAVVGMNGSGKTTFIKLLCRLYDPTEGEILLDGVDIRKYDHAEYLSLFSVVFQDFKLFSAKLGENVASGRGYDAAAVETALRRTGFGEKLSSLRSGAETFLYKDCDADGVNVSGGEAQKIAIARALYKDAPFIILDEPTAALDPFAEAEIYSSLNEIAGGRTAIYISHRLSSCQFCDKIAVFHEGEVVQQGAHAALVADETGKYCELWHAQAQYYAKEAV